jgi:polysaccharide biosynthesis transport protein
MASEWNINVEIRQQVRIVRSWMPLLIGCVLLTGGITYVITSGQPNVYEANARLLVGQSLSGVNPDYNQLLVSQRLSATYATVATTDQTLSKVIESLDLPSTPAELQRQVVVVASQDTALLSITARAGNPAAAAAIANAVAAELIAASPAVEGQQTDILESVQQDIAAIRMDIKNTQTQIDDLLAKADRTPTQEALLQTYQGRVVSLRSTYATLLSFVSSNGANVLTVVQPAIPPDAPIGPRPLLNALLAAMLAFLIVSAIVFVAEYLDDALRTPKNVDEVLGLPTLSTIERMPGGKKRPGMYRLATLLYPRSQVAETFRILRTNLEFATIDQPARTLLVTSAMPSEGKTVIAANLAVAIAQGGQRVLLVDADVRKPGVHQIFNLPNIRGLTDLLRTPVLNYASFIQRTEADGLEILSAGPVPPNPAEILGSQRMRTLVATLTGAYDIVVLDSPPLELVADPAVLSAYLNGTILVVEARRGRRSHLRHAREALAKANANVLGVVLNGVAPAARSEYGGYYFAANEVANDSNVAPAATVGSMAVAKDVPTTKVKSS